MIEDSQGFVGLKMPRFQESVLLETSGSERGVAFLWNTSG
jgi:hypothetical protein